MNYTFLNGRMCGEPVVCILPLKIEGIVRQLFVCKFVIAVQDEAVTKKKKYNFFECVAFEETAKKINNSFRKGAKVTLMSKLVNHNFKDSNNTLHFTNILLVKHAEFGDTESAINKMNVDVKLPDFAVLANLEEMEKSFDAVCEQGFLCIDENHYYNIASSNMDLDFV